MPRIIPLVFFLFYTFFGFAQNADLANALEEDRSGLKEFGGYVNQIQQNSEAANRRDFKANEGILTEKQLSAKLKVINNKREANSALLLYLFKPKHLEIYLIDETGLVAAQGIDITADLLFAYETSLRTTLGVDNFLNQNTTLNA